MFTPLLPALIADSAACRAAATYNTYVPRYCLLAIFRRRRFDAA